MDPQPWRNPRPAPSWSEIRVKTPTPRWLAWLWAWWPAIAWAAMIFTMSTDTFSAEHTSRILEPVLRWLIPSLSAPQFEVIHYFIRKSAHFSEYFVFFLLLYRAVRAGRRGWRWSWGITALLIAAAYSAADEFHQSFVPSRGSSAYDSLLDTTGAFVALIAIWLWFRRRCVEVPPQPSDDSAI